MKQLSYFTLVILSFFSCGKEMSFPEKYVQETYLLMNQAYLPNIEIMVGKNHYYDSILKFYNLPANRIYTKPYNQIPRKIDSYVKLSPFPISDSLLDLNKSNYIKNWSKSKLKNVLIIDSIKYNYLFSLDKEEHDSWNNAYDIWDTEVAGSFEEVSSPIFNELFNMAIVFTYENSPDPCGTFKFHALVFLKENGKWIETDYDFKNMEFL